MPDEPSSDVTSRVDDQQVKSDQILAEPDTLSISEPNGIHDSPQNGTSEPIVRGRKRKIDDLLNEKRGRRISPPWKKVAAEGPTSFVEDGRRKSSRTNTLPLELQPQAAKRQTRAGRSQPSDSKLRHVQTASSVPAKKPLKAISNATQGSSRKPKPTPAKSPAAFATTPAGTPVVQRAKKLDTSSISIAHIPQAAKQPPSHEQRQEGLDLDQQHRKRRRRRPSGTAVNPDGNVPKSKPSSSASLSAIESTIKPIRSLRINFRPPALPVLHPGNVVRNRQYSSFKSFLEQDDPLDGEEEQALNEVQARGEAQTVLHLETAAKPGGLLSNERWTGDAKDIQDEPSVPFTHPDYLHKHIIDFVPRLSNERERHQKIAKRLAQAAFESWKSRQPKTEEERLAEQHASAQALYITIMKELNSKWLTVRKFAMDQKVAQETAAMEAKTKDELKRMLDASSLNLKQRLAHESNSPQANDTLADSDSEEEENELLSGSNSMSDSDASSDSESNSAESVSENGAREEDDELTQEALRRKYSNMEDADALRTGEALAEHGVRSLSPGLAARWRMSDSGYEESGENIVTPNINPHTELDIPVEADDAIQSDVDEPMPMLEEVDELMLDDSDEEDDDDEDDEEEDEEEESDDSSNDSESALNAEDVSEHDGTLKSNLLGFYNPRQQKLFVSHSNDLPVQEASATAGAEEEDENEVDMVEDETQLPTGSEAESEDVVDAGSSLLGFYTERQQQSFLATNAKQAPLVSGPSANERHLSIQSQLESGTELCNIVEVAEADTVHDVKPSILSSSHQIHTDEAVTPNFNSSDEASRQMSPSASTNAKPSEADSMTSAEAYDEMDVVNKKDLAEPESYKTEVSTLLRGQLRIYQHAGLDWLAGMYANRTNGILADEMGLGKTIQTIALLAHLATEHHVWGPHLIVVPTSVMLNWEMEFKKWCPGFKILTYYGTQDERKQKRRGWTDDDRWNVCITSYQLALQDAFALKRRNWHYMVLDEAHNIKNSRSQRWQTLLNFKTEARLLLTGTPLQNNLTELWSLLFFLAPEQDEQGGFKFSDLATFSRTFHKPVETILEHGRQDMDDEARELVMKLHKVLRPHLLRRLKADVEKQMPKKYEHIVKCRLSKRQRQLYDGYMGLAGTRESFQSGNYMSIIGCLMQLRKVCNHPDLFETRQIVTSYAMPRSAVADYEIRELLVRKQLGETSLANFAGDDIFNLWRSDTQWMPTQGKSIAALDQLSHAIAQQDAPLQSGPDVLGYGNVSSSLAQLDARQRQQRLDELKNQYHLTAVRASRRPMFSSKMLERLTISQPLRQLAYARLPTALVDPAIVVPSLVTSLPQRADLMNTTIQKFGCITPAVVAPDVARLALTKTGVDLVQHFEDDPSTSRFSMDPYHESRIRLSIAFPDKSLIQYDCGKLQQLARLLRNLQTGGHRALIFTQMTKVLDILETFLNLHGYRYLRLDGATKLEQRQLLTDRFNNDPRIPVFILSSRSGGLGINLTGADTVIFYDLDWNPAMDKQCQDRCHRIGQTRDVHIYRFVSEGTIEANILRKSNQKRMLDDVVIQEGDFTTDFFNRIDPKEFLDDDEEADKALDMVFRGGVVGGGRGISAGDAKTENMLEQAEDVEDRIAAKQAQSEFVETDEADFEETTTKSASTPGGESSKVQTPVTDSPVPILNIAATTSEDVEMHDANSPSTAAGVVPPTVPERSAPHDTKEPRAAPTSTPITGPLAETQQATQTRSQPQPQAEAEYAADESTESVPEEPGSWEEFMLRHMSWELKDTVVKVTLNSAAERARKKAKKGKDYVPRSGGVRRVRRR